MVPGTAGDGLYYVSQGCAAPIAYPFSPKKHFYRIDPTYSFYQLRLAANPEEVSRTAMDRAQYDLYYANQELRKLGYWDPPYAPLDRVFSQAATEWIKGEFYQNLAERTQGNENTSHWAKAIRSFTRCQAIAKKVYNALVPPATRPEDLGLRPWGYWSRGA